MSYSKLDLFKDKFTRDSAKAMLDRFRFNSLNDNIAFSRVFAALRDGYFIDGRGKKIWVDYDLSKYTPIEFEAFLKANEIKTTPTAVSTLPKKEWIPQSLFPEE